MTLDELTADLIEARKNGDDTSRIVLKIADALPDAYDQLDEIPTFDLEPVA
jgi:hypothetical protein